MKKTSGEEYKTMQEAAAYCKVSIRTMYRMARYLGVEVVKYGRHLVPASELASLKESRKGRGNPNWIASPELAASAAVLAAKSRAKNRKARS